jgi:hypothetical protein
VRDWNQTKLNLAERYDRVYGDDVQLDPIYQEAGVRLKTYREYIIEG